LALDHPAFVEHQRRRFMRPDAERYARPDAARIKPPAGQADAQLERDLALLAAGARGLRRLVAELRLDLARRAFARKYGFNPDQPRVPAGNPDGGRWTDAGGGLFPSGAQASDGKKPRIRVAGDLPPLKRLHPDSTYESDQKAKGSLNYWRRQSTEGIVESLKPGSEQSRKVYPSGSVADGNTRIKVLQERGYDLNSLPRELHSSQPSGRAGGGGAGSVSGGGRMLRLWPWQ
jgi:hypothetical protein